MWSERLPKEERFRARLEDQPLRIQARIEERCLLITPPPELASSELPRYVCLALPDGRIVQGTRLKRFDLTKRTEHGWEQYVQLSRHNAPYLEAGHVTFLPNGEIHIHVVRRYDPKQAGARAPEPMVVDLSIKNVLRLEARQFAWALCRLPRRLLNQVLPKRRS